MAENGMVAPALTGLGVRGFKSIAEADVEIRPLTILAGANSSGKSSLLQPLLLLKQTLEAQGNPGPLRLDGPNVLFTRAEQFLHRRPGETVGEFSVELRLEGGKTVGAAFDTKEDGADVVATSLQADGHRHELRRGMAGDALLTALPAPVREQLGTVLGDYAPCVESSRCFLEARGFATTADGHRLVWPYPVFMPARDAGAALLDLVHVPAWRGNPGRDHAAMGVGPRFPGRFDWYAASVCLHWQQSGDCRLAEVGRQLGLLGLATAVDACALEGHLVELRVPRTRAGGRADLVSIADVGFGVSQVLPTVVALLAAAPGQLVYIEEPEIHLHPRAQLAMATLLAESARRGVRAIVETHSDLLILGVQTLVAQGEVDPALVKLHWFTRDDGGVTTVESRDLDAAGRYGDWPEDFGEVTLHAQNAYLDAGDAHLFGVADAA
jgi:predicted ATPase